MIAGIFHPGWVFHHRAAANSGALARVLVDRMVTPGDWNPETGVIGEVRKPIYQGTAQIQKVAFPTNRRFLEDQAKFQRVEVTIGFETNELTPSTYDVHVNDRVLVLDNPSDPEKVGTTFYVQGDGSSSNSWQRTLVCTTDLKQGNG